MRNILGDCDCVRKTTFPHWRTPSLARARHVTYVCYTSRSPILSTLSRHSLGLEQRRLGRSRRVTPGSADKSGHAREKQRVLSMAKGRSRAASSRLGALEYMMVAQLTPPFEPAKAVRLSWRAQRRPSAAGAAASAAPDPLLPPSGRFYHSTRCCSSGLHCRAVTVTRPLRRRRRWQRWRRR